MSTVPYISGRKKYERPQAMLWSENSGTLVEDPNSTTVPKQKVYVPNGLEIGQDPGEEVNPTNYDQFLILSDDNRSPLSFSTTRIEVKQRMINGRMRSYHIADKLTLSVSWEKLPSRSYFTVPDFNATTGKSPNAGLNMEYTTDGGAGGVEILDWYEKHQGPFWVYLAYDKYSNFGKDQEAYGHIKLYNQLIQMYFTNFSYSVEKRSDNFDFWNIQLTLEEV
ncbi:hypothetical protein EB001_16115 [bacterium]|jgi:hypothetical protein|nr:hypothetical protein [bacterium]